MVAYKDVQPRPFRFVLPLALLLLGGLLLGLIFIALGAPALWAFVAAFPWVVVGAFAVILIRESSRKGPFHPSYPCKKGEHERCPGVSDWPGVYPCDCTCHAAERPTHP